MTWILYAVAGVLTLSALATVSAVGKPRKPLEPSTAVAIVIVNALMVTGLILVAAQP